MDPKAIRCTSDGTMVFVERFPLCPAAFISVCVEPFPGVISYPSQRDLHGPVALKPYSDAHGRGEAHFRNILVLEYGMVVSGHGSPSSAPLVRIIALGRSSPFRRALFFGCQEIAVLRVAVRKAFISAHLL